MLNIIPFLCNQNVCAIGTLSALVTNGLTPLWESLGWIYLCPKKSSNWSLRSTRGKTILWYKWHITGIHSGESNQCWVYVQYLKDWGGWQALFCFKVCLGLGVVFCCLEVKGRSSQLMLFCPVNTIGRCWLNGSIWLLFLCSFPILLAHFCLGGISRWVLCIFFSLVFLKHYRWRWILVYPTNP